jgi:hypothetical protein
MQIHLNTIIAYVDPGTGSYCFQLLIAGVTAAWFALSSFKTKIVSVFKKLEKTEQQPTSKPVLVKT